MTKTLRYAVKHSFPIFISFIPVGLAYGVLMESAGYNFLWTGACSLFVMAGSLQYLMVSFFAGGVSLATVAIMALLLNSRHIFYGLSFIEKFRSFGFWKYFLIYSLTDENYSLHCSHDFPDDIDEKWAYVLTAVMPVLYWIFLSVAGALIGTLIPFDTTGIDFALTALFIVIAVGQWRAAGSHFPALLGGAATLLSLLVVGAEDMLLPALGIIVAVLTLMRSRQVEEQIKQNKKEVRV